ncbi:MAG TPA: hypothetical protein VGO78_22490 [Acidimicrobiales bacterium]|nr:hypothetical protein [Acidimicrobiales bacterium]
MSKIEPKKIVIGLVVAFVALTVWNDPHGAGESTGDFVSNAGSFVSDAFDKANEFSKSIVE